jgi:ankyrin repeat protein
LPLSSATRFVCNATECCAYVLANRIEKRLCTGRSKRHSETAALTLLESGAAAECIDKHARTPLHTSAMVCNAACIDVLLRVGCSNVNAKDFDNNTALRLAIRGGHAAAAMLLEDAGADVKLRSSFGNTPLYGTREDIFLFCMCI